MLRSKRHTLVMASLGITLLAPAVSHAASLVQVNRATWAGSVTLPSYMQMYIYVPDNRAAKPPIYISAHSCGSTATGQMANIPKAKAAADAQGFILILPHNQDRNCWDVGSMKALTHDGGGDTHAVAQMVKYTIATYNADAARVYVMGGSGGGMLVQALLAVYPDVFRAGVARAGVPAGCWADGYDDGQQWSNNCANGTTNKTAQQWGDQVRAMYMGYTGHRPRLMTHQGTNDTTISYNNTRESIEEWTNVMMLPTTPTMTDTGFRAQIATYDRQIWKNACGESVFEAWSSPGGTHSMPYEEDQMLQFFGLDAPNKPDPETGCGSGGMGGMGGSSAGGAAGASTGGAAGMTGGGGMAPMGGAGGTLGGAGMMPGSGAGGTPGSGGMVTTTGGSAGTVGVTGGTGGASGTTGTTGGTVGTTGGAGATTGGIDGATGGADGTAETEPAGCGCRVSEPKSKPAYALAAALGLAAIGWRRRRRNARR
jgi:poly(hydroxyalkanoate) depolymerase family esterase